MRDYAWALSVVNSAAFTAVEKVGHLKLAYSEDGEEVVNHLKLISNFRWLAGPYPVINRVRGGFDPVSRVFWFSFDREDYFDGGGKAAITDFLSGLKKFGGMAVAGRGDSCWWGVFPASRISSPPSEEAAHEGKEVEEETTPLPTVEKVFVPKVIRRRK